jgi:RNA polymerase sigma factor (sigma-70 family)
VPDWTPPIPEHGILQSEELAPTPSGAVDDAASLQGLDGLVRNHHPELRKHVYRHVGSWADADDIVQQTYVNFFNKGLLGKRGPKVIDNVRAYLFKMAGNLAHDWVRKRRVRDTFAEDELLRTLEVAHSTEEVCESRDEFAVLLTRIEELPPQCRRALLLYRHEGLSLEEVGKELGIQPKSVHALISRAMKYLLQAVSEESIRSGRGR